MKQRIDIKVFFGVAIIVAGIILFLDNIGFLEQFGLYLDINFFDFWPLILIAIGLNQVMQPKEARQSFSGWIFIGLGAFFLIDNFYYIPFGFWDLWPVVLILIGLSILRNHPWQKSDEEGGNDFINLSFILGGGDHKFTSQAITGGRVTAIMGGGTIDLRQASTKQESIIIDTFAMWEV